MPSLLCKHVPSPTVRSPPAGAGALRQGQDTDGDKRKLEDEGSDLPRARCVEVSLRCWTWLGHGVTGGLGSKTEA